MSWLASFPDSCAVELKSVGSRVLNFLGRGRKSFSDGFLTHKMSLLEEPAGGLGATSISNRIFTFRSNRENVVGGALVVVPRGHMLETRI